MSKSALITGGTSGIGKYIALELAKQGFNIILNYRNIYKHNKIINNIVYIFKKILKIFIAGIFIYICYNLLNINLLLSKLIVDILLTIILFIIFRNVGFKDDKKN